MLRKILLVILLLVIPSISSATDEVVSVQGVVLEITQTVQSSDSVATLPADIIVTTGRRASAVFITCEDANIRWTVGGVDPIAASLGHILYNEGGIRISNGDWIRTFRYVSAVAGAPARLQITAEYNN